MDKLSVSDLSPSSLRILLRVDYNVPLSSEHQVEDISRIRASLPTLQYLLERNNSVILVSHLGSPKGKKDPGYSLAPVAKILSSLLDRPVQFCEETARDIIHQQASSLRSQECLLLENLRFHPGEEHPDDDPTFAPFLAGLADLYVNDAFGCAHRSHASITKVPLLFPNKAAAGFLMAREIKELSFLLEDPPSPFFAILGGAKVSSKAKVISKLAKKVNGLFLGGALSFPFLGAQGISFNSPPYSNEDLETARTILLSCKAPIHLPRDLWMVSSEKNPPLLVPLKRGTPLSGPCLDIGPQTLREWGKSLSQGHTFFWNGPMGQFEKKPFHRGTEGLARLLASTRAHTIAGGGETSYAIQTFSLSHSFEYISTGGGASLFFLESGSLPGIDVLSPQESP